MFVELHMLQNFAPSCLNRDDTNSPKECEFGGHRRARISSQCIKRAIRRCFKDQALLSSDQLATRSKLLVQEVAARLRRQGKKEAQAPKVVETALKGLKLSVDEDGLTQYLLFLGEKEIGALTALCAAHWDALVAASAPAAGGQDSAKKKKKAAKESVPVEIQKALAPILDGGKAADLALFGRMLADLPERNIDAACQMAHALSTNKVGIEFDFFTAVDDLQPKAETGAGMMGTVEFNSACFYRYANIDLEQLKKNLSNDEDLAKKTVEAFLRASVTAIPTGKQNSMAAQNPPSFVFAVVRDRGLWSLANAFVEPIRPDGKAGLVVKSRESLERYWERLVSVYTDKGIRAYCAVSLDAGKAALPDVKTLDGLVKTVVESISFEPSKKEARK